MEFKDLWQQIPIAAFGAMGTLLLWALYRLYHIDKHAMTREEHDRICMERSARVEKQLIAISEQIAKNAEESSKHRHDVRSQLQIQTATIARLDERTQIMMRDSEQ